MRLFAVHVHAQYQNYITVVMMCLLKESFYRTIKNR